MTAGDDFEERLERRKAESRLPLTEKSPRLVYALYALLAVIVFGGVVWTLHHFFG